MESSKMAVARSVAGEQTTFSGTPSFPARLYRNFVPRFIIRSNSTQSGEIYRHAVPAFYLPEDDLKGFLEDRIPGFRFQKVMVSSLNGAASYARVC